MAGIAGIRRTRDDRDMTTSLYLVINCNQMWLNKSDVWRRFHLSCVRARVVEYFNNKVEWLVTYVSFEIGARSGHPHINLVVDWVMPELSEDQVYEDLIAVLGDHGEDADDVHIQPIYAYDSLIDYCEKEHLLSIRDNQQDPDADLTSQVYCVVVPGNFRRTRRRPRLEQEEERAPIRLPQVMEVVKDNFPDPICNVHTMEMFFAHNNMSTAYVLHHDKLVKLVRHLQKNRELQERHDRYEACTNDAAMYWLEWVCSQDRPFELIAKLSRLLRPRDKVRDPNCIVACGKSRAGKTWCMSFLEHKAYVGHLNINQRGVGNFDQCLQHDALICNDPKEGKWTQVNRQMVLNLMAGDPFPIKVHSATDNVLVPKHLVVTCNRVPQEFVDPTNEIRRRVNMWGAVPYRRGMNISALRNAAALPPLPAYNPRVVFEYLEKHHDDLQVNKIPCMCSMWETAPCRFATDEDELPMRCLNRVYTLDSD